MPADAASASFVDTNIFVYALASDDSQRSPLAQKLIRELMEADALHTSTQVLQELFVTLTRKVRAPLSVDLALQYLDQIASWPVAIIDYSAVRAAVDLSTRASLSFWDALIVVTAARSGATRLYTEDLQHGRSLLGIEVVNPFLPLTQPRRRR